MNRKPALYAAILFILALMLGACRTAPATTPGPAAPAEMPTATPEPTVMPQVAATEEILPSPSPEPTVESTCAGLFMHELTLYPIPSDALPGERMGAGAFVDIIGELNEPVWYQIRLVNRTGWALQAYVRKDNPDCKASQRSLAEVLGLQGTPVLEDTFRDSQNWYMVNPEGERPERLPDSVDNYTLNLDGYFQRVSASAPALEDLPPFELATSFWRQNGGDSSSYVGIRYGDETQYFEVRVLGSCEIEVTTADGFYEKQVTRNERNRCKDDISDLIYVNWDGSGTLRVAQNNIEDPYKFNIGTDIPEIGQIQLVAEAARVQVDFIAVTVK